MEYLEVKLMGEARQRNKTKKSILSQKPQIRKKEGSPKIFAWLPITIEQEKMFMQATIRGGWIGIGLLVALWIVVRIVGPAAGWWVPADLK